MIIRELELTNIRSHPHSLIRFPEGRTLLEGDIGSGKSSVLMAIEFALFGLGSTSGNSLLRVGEESGGVRMVFDVDGSEYEVVRRLLRKAGRAQQADGYLRTPAETANLSPSELKERVLEVLEFDEAPDPKAQSWIYRYAIYTPQEEMKDILTLAPEQRLQILRRAFRVEDYKTAATNAEDAVRELRVQTSGLDALSRGIGELKGRVEGLQREEARHREGLAKQEEKEAEEEGRVASIRAEREELQRREVELQAAKTEKEYYERVQTESEEEVRGLSMEIEELTKGPDGLSEAIKEERALKASSFRPAAELKRKERGLEERVKKLTGLKAAVESKLSDYESIMKEGVCPVCDRPVEAHDFEARKAGKAAEREHVGDELDAAEAELAAIREKREEAERHLAEKKSLALRRREVARARKDLAKKEAARKRFERRRRFAKGALGEAARKLTELERLVAQRQAVDRRLSQAEERLRRARDEVVSTREKLDFVGREQMRIATELVAKEEASGKSSALKERALWLSDYFLPTVRQIEKSVLASINREFDALFQKWFGMLVNDPDKEGRVDEDFAPVVSQGGYEQEVRYLSGGERTSVALAFRLALNVLTKRVSAGMRSNLLILDEPTDGFSKEQLGSVREVLDDVGCPQVIIVSHDEELESFADQIFRVGKSGTESAVRVPTA
jgi:DNA repair protein SbcC/Rad50